MANSPLMPSPKPAPDVEVINVPNTLAPRVGFKLGALAPTALAKAEAALKELSGQFGQWLEDEIVKLETAREAVRVEGLNRQTADRLYLHAHDLKGLGGTYQFPLVTRVAGSLSKLLAEPDTRAHAPLNVIDAHIQAIRAIVRDDIRAPDHPVGVALCQTLEESVRHHMPTDDSGSSTRP
jgi:hypothetical protein